MCSFKNALAALLLTVVFTACQNESEPATGDGTGEIITEDTLTGEAPSADNPQPQSPQKTASQIVGALVMQWNIAINNKDYKQLANLYAEEVSMHGQVFTNAELVARKQHIMQLEGQTYQQLLGGAEVNVHSPTVAKAEFIKKVTNRSGTRSYNAYLMFEKIDNGWKIVAEGDEATDAAVKEQKMPKVNVADIISCDKAVEAVFLSSPVVQNLLKQPYAKYKLEFTPGAPDNPNHRYWFWVYANAPNSQSVETYGRFQVDAETGQLYEFKAIEDKAVPITSSVSYQQYIKKYCIPRPQ